MNFRNATFDDLEAISELESLSFPANEAASYEAFTQRLQIFPQHFWLLEEKGKLIGYTNGMTTDNQTITDEMFASAELHNEDGAWQTIFGIAVLPEFRRQGCAGQLINHLIAKSKEQNRSGIILTCKKLLLPYYIKFGFLDLGVSKSVHGGAIWHDMVLKF